MTKWIMVLYGIVGTAAFMLEPKNSIRELEGAMIMMLGFGFAFVIHAIEETKK